MSKRPGIASLENMPFPMYGRLSAAGLLLAISAGVLTGCSTDGDVPTFKEGARAARSTEAIRARAAAVQQETGMLDSIQHAYGGSAPIGTAQEDLCTLGMRNDPWSHDQFRMECRYSLIRYYRLAGDIMARATALDKAIHAGLRGDLINSDNGLTLTRVYYKPLPGQEKGSEPALNYTVFPGFAGPDGNSVVLVGVGWTDPHVLSTLSRLAKPAQLSSLARPPLHEVHTIDLVRLAAQLDIQNLRLMAISVETTYFSVPWQ
jgi:hypothetical protein